MLKFDSRQDAYDHCLINVDDFNECKEVYLCVIDGLKLSSNDSKLIYQSSIKKYSDVFKSVKKVQTLGIRNADKVSIVLDELLMNGLKGKGEYSSLKEIEAINLTHEEQVDFEIHELEEDKVLQVRVKDKNGLLSFDNVYHSLDEKVVEPRLEAPLGGGFGLRVVALYANRIEFDVKTKKETQVIVNIPYRNKRTNDFEFLFRRSHVE